MQLKVFLIHNFMLPLGWDESEAVFYYPFFKLGNNRKHPIQSSLIWTSQDTKWLQEMTLSETKREWKSAWWLLLVMTEALSEKPGRFTQIIWNKFVIRYLRIVRIQKYLFTCLNMLILYGKNHMYLFFYKMTQETVIGTLLVSISVI